MEDDRYTRLLEDRLHNGPMEGRFYRTSAERAVADQWERARDSQNFLIVMALSVPVVGWFALLIYWLTGQPQEVYRRSDAWKDYMCGKTDRPPPID